VYFVYFVVLLFLFQSFMVRFSPLLSLWQALIVKELTVLPAR
jgi:hypothetical protein